MSGRQTHEAASVAKPGGTAMNLFAPEFGVSYLTTDELGN